MTVTPTVAALATRLEQLEARNAALEAEVRALRAAPSPADHPPPAPLGRRQPLGRGLAAAGAAAANGNPLVIGSITTTTTGTNTTSLGVEITPVANTLVWGGHARRFSTLAVTTVDSAARCQVTTSLATDLVIDVVGHYR